MAGAGEAGGDGPLAAHMLEHQWATDLLYQGLVMPSEERWQKGLAAMQGSPLAEKDLPKDAKLTKEIAALEKKVHEMAAKAKTATDLGTKVAFYGEYLGGCAGCHSCTARSGGRGCRRRSEDRHLEHQRHPRARGAGARVDRPRAA